MQELLNLLEARLNCWNRLDWTLFFQYVPDKLVLGDFSMTYLLAVLININNFNPVIVNDCLPLKKDNIKLQAEKTANDLSKTGFVCEKTQIL